MAQAFPARLKAAVTTKRWGTVTMALFLIVGAFLRLYRLDRESFWFDEIDTVTTAALPLRQMFQGIAWHTSAPLDYFILHFILPLGNSEAHARLPAALYSIGTIYVLYRAGRRLVSETVGVGAAALLTFSLMSIAYAQEVRMYSLFLLLTTVLLWCCGWVMAEPLSWKRWGVTGVVGLLTLYSHYFAALVLGGLGLLWLFATLWPRWNRALFARGAVTFSAIGLLFAPWIPTMLVQSARWRGALPHALAREDYWRIVRQGLSGGMMESASWLLVALFVVGFAYCAARRRRVALLLVAFTVLPVVLSYFVPRLAAIVTGRNLICALPGYLLGIATGFDFLVRSALSRFRRRAGVEGHVPASPAAWLTVAGLTALALFPSWGMLQQFHSSGWWMKSSRTDWRQTAEFLQRSMQPGDMVLVDSPGTRYQLSFYLDPAAIQGINVYNFAYNPENALSGAARAVPIVSVDAPPEPLREVLAGAREVWIVNSAPEMLEPIGIYPSLLTPVENGLNIPLAHLPQQVVRLLFATNVELSLHSDDRTLFIREGWAHDLIRQDDGWYARTQGTRSTLEVPLMANRAYTMSLTLRPFDGPQSLQARVNGVPVGEPLPIAAEGWGTYEVAVPADVVRAGANTIELEHVVTEDDAASFSIGTTGATAPAAVVAEAIAHDYGNQATIYVGETSYTHELAGRGYGRGYTVLALDPEGQLLGWDAFDTCCPASPAESLRMAEFIGALPEGAIVAMATKDDASGALTEEAVAAIRSVGGQVDLRGQFRWMHALVGVKGAAPGTAVEVVDEHQASAVVGPDTRGNMLLFDTIRLVRQE